MSKQMSNQINHFWEGGFTGIPNYMLEALVVSKISSTQIRLCLHLLRCTYGWRREAAAVSLNDFAIACASAKPWISPQVQELVDKNVMIRIEKQAGKKPVYKINPVIAEWDVSSIDTNDLEGQARTGGLSSDLTQGLSSDLTQGLSPDLTQGFSSYLTQGLSFDLTPDPVSSLEQSNSQQQPKKGLNKIKENIYFREDSICYTLSKLLLDKILLHITNYKKPDLQKWSASMEKLIRLDNRDPEEVKRVIIYAQSDPFWQGVILSVDNLRKKYDYLNSQRLTRAGKSRLYSREAGDKDKYDFFFKD